MGSWVGDMVRGGRKEVCGEGTLRERHWMWEEGRGEALSVGGKEGRGIGCGREGGERHWVWEEGRGEALGVGGGEGRVIYCVYK